MTGPAATGCELTTITALGVTVTIGYDDDTELDVVGRRRRTGEPLVWVCPECPHPGCPHEEAARLTWRAYRQLNHPRHTVERTA
ncbi:hypothetical protein MM440_12290 [Arsenicicoccus piscis]|uniref:Uncharacterized protein n=1 Tax=Arsenicicoccus piscis TaxID=673954 RepID=A0ABQ6HP09_9MICO|nr:hypothetical protein [Arsenicicoccus piscis]MCH8628524.1 hypothetical protein [Arsenicicoccus piscis]GMA19897.1 hypothetical protein GCM10025862_19180 [Arsenicicoccus piscis]